MPNQTIDGNLVVSGNLTATSVGVGATPQYPLDITQAGDNYAGRISCAHSALYITHATDRQGAPGDLIDIVHRSSGDAIYVVNRGGAPPGYTGPLGGCASFNVMIPYYLDGEPDRRNGTVVNNRSGAQGLYIEVQPTGDVYGMSIQYSGRQAAMTINNQPDGFPTGNGQALKIVHRGSAAGMHLTNYGSGNGVTIQNRGTGGALLIDDYSTGVIATLSLTSYSTPWRNAILMSTGSEPYARVTFTFDGHFRMGPGTATQDCDLQRGGPHQWLTNDTFIARDGLATKTKAGAPTDADFQAAPPNGMLAVDTTNQRLYVRVGGAWKSLPLQ